MSEAKRRPRSSPRLYYACACLALALPQSEDQAQRAEVWEALGDMPQEEVVGRVDAGEAERGTLPPLLYGFVAPDMERFMVSICTK